MSRWSDGLPVLSGPPGLTPARVAARLHAARAPVRLPPGRRPALSRTGGRAASARPCTGPAGIHPAVH
ncbi:hypothetical protein, partial [Streptomyces jumonjinensis]|uniref:hypothetical protein n=1 Tax=Streptomyces jumonjinensis TaxID=1945 RepID=UPI001E35F679